MNNHRLYVTEQEAERLMHAAGQLGRNGHRDKTMILVAYTHGLRVSELVGLTWNQVDLDEAHIHVNRVKKGNPSVHPLRGREIRALRKLRRENPDKRHVFLSELGGPMTTRAFELIVKRAGEKAGLDQPAHPHMLRHGCGFRLANMGQDTRAIQDYLGHKNIQHTVKYTKLSPRRFDNFWDD